MFIQTIKFLNKIKKISRSIQNAVIINSRSFINSAISVQNDRLLKCNKQKKLGKQAFSTEGSAAETIVVDKDETITLIGINRVKTRNTINLEVADKLSKAISEFEMDKSSPVAVLYGVGGSFCSGYDIDELQSHCAKGNLDFLKRHQGSLGPTRRHNCKPIVCGINGYCVAGGLELALMCDLRVMENNAILGFFNRRFGVPMSDGGTVRLGRIVGHSRALDLVLSGRRMTGEEALEIGLVNRLVATGTALGQAVALAFSIAKFPQSSIVHDRNALYINAYSRHGFNNSIQTEIMNTSREVLAEVQEGVQRFKKSKTKGSKTNSFQIKVTPIPDWEKSEIEHEKNHEQSASDLM